MYNKNKIIEDLKNIGIKKGDVVLVHSSYKSLGVIEGGAKTFFEAFLDVIGEEGTLILPALSYETVTRENPCFDKEKTPSCVGYLTEYFRTKLPGVIRSMHATHSCCAVGKYAEEIVKDHEKDITPIGENSPFTKLKSYNGKILMLGCNPARITMMHGVEEVAKTPYGIDWENTIDYVLKNGDKCITITSYRHQFDIENIGHIVQRYERIINLLDENEVSHKNVLEADCYLLDAKAAWEKGLEKMKEEPYYFVDYPKITNK